MFNRTKNKKNRTISLKGRVSHGLGEGAKFVGLPWAGKQIKEKFGFTPYPGTLNIKLEDNYIKDLKILRNAYGVEIAPPSGYNGGKCFKAYLMDNFECAVVIPEVEGYPEDLVEIVAPLNLRIHFKLKDGDIIMIKVQF
jgi:riboflavin kinase